MTNKITFILQILCLLVVAAIASLSLYISLENQRHINILLYKSFINPEYKIELKTQEKTQRAETLNFY